MSVTGHCKIKLLNRVVYIRKFKSCDLSTLAGGLFTARRTVSRIVVKKVIRLDLQL